MCQTQTQNTSGENLAAVALTNMTRKKIVYDSDEDTSNAETTDAPAAVEDTTNKNLLRLKTQVRISSKSLLSKRYFLTLTLTLYFFNCLGYRIDRTVGKDCKITDTPVTGLNCSTKRAIDRNARFY